MAVATAPARFDLKGLPNKLSNFFTSYPPDIYSARVTQVSLPLTRKEAKEAAILKNEAKKQAEDEPVQKRSRTTKTGTVPNTMSKPLTEASNSHPASPAKPNTTQPTKTEPSSIAAQTTLSPPTKPLPSAPEPLRLNSRLVDGLTRSTRFPSNPFLPFKNPATGHWASPRISLRRQADLCRLARKYHVEDLLPPSRKSSAFKQARILERGLRVKGTGEGQSVKGHKWERMLPMTLQARTEALEAMPALIREWQAKGHGRGWKKWPKAKTR